MDLKRIRKALLAGALAAASILGTQVTKDGLPANPDGWVALLGSMAGAFVVGAWAVYSVRNEGTINGSDPLSRRV